MSEWIYSFSWLNKENILLAFIAGVVFEIGVMLIRIPASYLIKRK